MGNRLFPFEVELPLDGSPARSSSSARRTTPRGGAEGNGPAIDTKTITVR